MPAKVRHRKDKVPVEFSCPACRYVLSEFADEITEREPSVLAEQLALRFTTCPLPTQALLLTAILKLRMAAMSDSALRTRAEALFASCTRQHDAELQQRAAEYLALSRMGEDSVVVRETVLAPMPEWSGCLLYTSPSPRD